MKKILVLLCLTLTTSASAQLPVIDVANVAQTIAAVARLGTQVRIMLDDLAVTRNIEHGTQSINRTTRGHFDRYQRALTKRGVVPSMALEEILHGVEQGLKGPDAISYADPGLQETLESAWIGYAQAEDPLAYEQAVSERQIGTMEGALRSLAAHGWQLHESHRELERFKQEIASNLEPQQMRDVQASLQVLGAREAMLTRQAIMTLANLDAVRAATAANQRAQERMVYTRFIGNTDWLGNPAQYRMDRFLRMPGR